MNATGFTLVNGVFLRERSLPYSSQVYVLSWRVRATQRRSALSHPEFEDWRAQSRAFAHLAALTTATMNISDDRALPEQAFGSRISPTHSPSSDCSHSLDPRSRAMTSARAPLR